MPQRNRRLRIERLNQRHLLAANPVEVLDLPPDETPLREMTALEGKFLFARSDADSGSELWMSDGTAAGTRLLRDIRPGPQSSDPRDLTRVGNTIFFTAAGDAGGREVWRTDGTAGGTTVVTDFGNRETSLGGILGATDRGVVYEDSRGRAAFFQPADSNSAAVDLTFGFVENGEIGEIGFGKEFFLFEEETSNISRLWISDGTQLGTQRVTGVVESISEFDGVLDTPTPGVVAQITVGGGDDIDHYYQIDGAGNIQQLTDPDEFRFIRSSPKFMTEHAVYFEALSGPSGEFVHAIDRFGNVNQLIEIDSSDGFVEVGDQVVFTFVPPGRSQSEGYPIATVNQNHEVTVIDGPRAATKMDTLPALSDNIFFEALTEDGQLEIVMLNITTGESTTIHQLTSEQAVRFLSRVGELVVFQIDQPDMTLLRSVKQDGSPGGLNLDLDRTVYPTQLSDLEIVGSELFGRLATEGGFDYVRIEPDSGQLFALAEATASAEGRLLRDGNISNVLPIDSDRFIFHGFFSNVPVSDGTGIGTVDLVSSDGNNFFGLHPRDSPSLHVDGVTYMVSANRIGRLQRGSNEVELFVPLDTIPSFQPTIGASDDGVLIVGDNDIYRLTSDSDELELAVEDHFEQTMTPLDVSMVGPGIDPFQNRVVSGGFASDGTPNRTGVVAALNLLQIELLDAGVPFGRHPNWVGNIHGAILAGSSRPGAVFLVERPTETALQPFFPLDDERTVDEITRLPDGWLATHQNESGDHEAWYWRDDLPEPRLAGNWGRLQLDTSVRVGTRHIVRRSNELFSTDGTTLIPFEEQIDPEFSNWSASILGNSGDAALIQMSRFSSRYFSWDGTRNGAVPLPTLDDLPERAGLSRSLDDQIYEFENYFLFRTSEGLLRAAKSEQLVRIDVPRLTLAATEDSVDALAGGQSVATYDVTGGKLLTIDASDFSRTIDLASPSRLPINGLRLVVAEGSLVRLDLPAGIRELDYVMRENQIIVFIDGRPLYIEGSSFTIEDALLDARREVRLTANDEMIELSSTREHAQLTAAGNNFTATLSFPHQGDPVLVLPGPGSDRVMVADDFDSPRVFEFVGNLDPTERDQIEVPDGYQIAQPDNDLGRLVTTFSNGTSRVRLDVSTAPLFNHARATDVNRDGETSALDALMIINELRRLEHATELTPNILPDVTGDNTVSALDALRVINEVTRAAAIQPEGSFFDASRLDGVLRSRPGDDDDAKRDQMAK